MSLGQRLRKARKEKGMTQKALAHMIQVKHNSVSNWENDQNKPDLNTFKRICDALDVSLSYLLDGMDAGDLEGGELTRLLSGTEFALLGAVRHLSEADKQDILDFVLFKAEQKEKRQRE